MHGTETNVINRRGFLKTAALSLGAATFARGHEHHNEATSSSSLKTLDVSPDLKFELLGEKFRVPAAAKPHQRGMHGQSIPDSETSGLFYSVGGNVVYLSSNGESRILLPEANFKDGNIHGLACRGDKLGAAFNNGKVQTFHVERDGRKAPVKLELFNDLISPDRTIYGKRYAPTDIEFTDGTLPGVADTSVADGYGKGVILEIDTAERKFVESTGVDIPFFKTPHGHHTSRNGDVLVVASRESHELFVFKLGKNGERIEAKEQIQKVRFDDMEGLKGSRPCDFVPHPELGIAAVPLLVGPKGRGAIAFMHFDGKQIGDHISTFQPDDIKGKVDFDPRHVHHASWWVVPGAEANQKNHRLAVHFWNPGGLAVFDVDGLPQS